MTKITFSEKAWDEYLNWQVQDRKTLKKINALLKDMQRQPYAGTGKPEPLIGDQDNRWSRRINEKDRIVYNLVDDTITIFQCKGHYNDK